MNARRDDVRDIRKVAVAFDPACASPALLHAASEFAGWLGADLEALIIDDADILRLTRLPFGRIVEPLSGKSMLFDDAAIRSRRAGPLARSRAVLRELSQRHRLSCSVRELPGMALSGAAGESTAELLVIASFHAKFGGDRTIDQDALEIASRSTGSVLLVSGFPLLTRKIAVVSDDSPAGLQAMAIATRLVRETDLSDAAIERLDPAGQSAPALVDRISAKSPTLVIVGLQDAEVRTALQEMSGTGSFSVLTVR